MSFSFSSLVRLLVLMGLGSTMLAIGLSRLHPPRPPVRTLMPVNMSNINEFFFGDFTDRSPLWVDHESGVMSAYPLEDGDVLETASCSPWVDEKNQRQVVGRWSTRIKDGPMSMSKDFGLARYQFPSGKMLDHVSTEIVPVGAPCWFPGIQARVVFTAGDGLLYQFAFESQQKQGIQDGPTVRDIRPWPVGWRCPKPGVGSIFLSDLNWPDDPRMGGCLVVSLREQLNCASTLAPFSRTSLWWLKLNHAGTEVVELGRLLVGDDSKDPDREFDHRCPTIGSLSDGRMALAYLRQKPGQFGWELRVAPIELERDRLTPRASESQSVLLTSRCQPTHPSFTSDGRFLNAITGTEAQESRIVRIPLAEHFPGAK